MKFTVKQLLITSALLASFTCAELFAPAISSEPDITRGIIGSYTFKRRLDEKNTTFKTKDNEVIQNFITKTPGLFGTVKQVGKASKAEAGADAGAQVNLVDPISKEIYDSTKKFFQLYEKSDIDPTLERGQLLIDKTKFLGQPIIAKVDRYTERKDDPVEYYLAVMHFNIPTVNPSFGPVKYAFARFATKFVLYKGDPIEDGETDLSSNSPNFAYRAAMLAPVDVVAVFPVNETLGIDRTDGSKLTVEAKPEWGGAAAGSVTQEWSKEEKYKLGLPTIVSSATKYGDAAWIFYPARAQPLILGTKTTMALLAIPKTAIKSGYKLRLQCSLDYQLKVLKFIPMLQHRLVAAATSEVKNVLSVDRLCSTHAIDIPDSMLALIKGTLKTPTPTPDYFVIERKTDVAGANDFALDKHSGELFRIVDNNLVKLIPLEKVPTPPSTLPEETVPIRTNPLP